MIRRSLCTTLYLTIIVCIFPLNATAKPADFDNDNLDDLALFNPSTATFDIRNSSTGSINQLVVGGVGSIPIRMDWNGDGTSDPATYDRSTGSWTIQVGGNLYRHGVVVPGINAGRAR